MNSFNREIDQINEALYEVRQDRKRLDPAVLRRKFADDNIKQFWVAEQLKVHKRTVLRWLNGQVREIRMIHAMQLAVLLKCTVEDFTLDHKSIKRSASQALSSRSFLVGMIGLTLCQLFAACSTKGDSAIKTNERRAAVESSFGGDTPSESGEEIVLLKARAPKKKAAVAGSQPQKSIVAPLETIVSSAVLAPSLSTEPQASNPCATNLTRVVNTGNDATAAIRACFGSTPAGGRVEFPPGVYLISSQLVLEKTLTLATKGRAGTVTCGKEDSHGCAEFKATNVLVARFGILILQASGIVLDHIVLNGNRPGRPAALAMCKNTALQDNNQFGMNAFWQLNSCQNCKMTGSTSKNAVCGSAGLVANNTGLSIDSSTFSSNGIHDDESGWSDGLTVLDCKGCRFTGNIFYNNTDVDLIFGGCLDCTIADNQIRHDGSYRTGAHAAMLFGAFAFSTSGNYTGSLAENNQIDCGTKNGCGVGLYLGNRAWYAANPVVNGTFRNIDIKNAQAGIVIDDVLGSAIGAIGAGPSNGGVRCAVKNGAPREYFALSIAPDSLPQFIDSVFGRDKYVTRSYAGLVPNSGPWCQELDPNSTFNQEIAQGRYIPTGFPACAGGKGYKPGNNSCLPSCGMQGTAAGLVPQIQFGACKGAGPWQNLGDTFDISPGQTCCGVQACPVNYGYKVGNNSCLPSCGLLGYASGFAPQIFQGGCPVNFTYLGDSYDAGLGLACCGIR